jgi:cyclin B
LFVVYEAFEWCGTCELILGRFHVMIFRQGAKMLVSSHAAAPEGDLKAIYQKYTSEEFGCVALHPPAAGPALV